MWWYAEEEWGEEKGQTGRHSQHKKNSKGGRVVKNIAETLNMVRVQAMHIYKSKVTKEAK
jgi:hypothetical protein